MINLCSQESRLIVRRTLCFLSPSAFLWTISKALIVMLACWVFSLSFTCNL